MKYILIALLLSTAPGLFAQNVQTNSNAWLPDIEVRSVSGSRVQLPQLAGEQSSTILIALTAGQTQENGQEQLTVLLQSQQQLHAEHPEFRNVPVFHLNVIAGAPFFVHGIIRRGLADSYSSPVRNEDVYVVFVSEVEEVTNTLNIRADAYATWLAVQADGRILWTLKDSGDNTAAILAENLKSPQ